MTKHELEVLRDVAAACKNLASTLREHIPAAGYLVHTDTSMSAALVKVQDWLKHFSPLDGNLSDDRRINLAMKVVQKYGGIDGSHHKQWVIDQMIRELLGKEGYKDFVCVYGAEDGFSWDVGIAP